MHSFASGANRILLARGACRAITKITKRASPNEHTSFNLAMRACRGGIIPGALGFLAVLHRSTHVRKRMFKRGRAHGLSAAGEYRARPVHSASRAGAAVLLSSCCFPRQSREFHGCRQSRKQTLWNSCISSLLSPVLCRNGRTSSVRSADRFRRVRQDAADKRYRRVLQFFF